MRLLEAASSVRVSVSSLRRSFAVSILQVPFIHSAYGAVDECNPRRSVFLEFFKGND